MTPTQRLARLNASPAAKSAWEAANLRGRDKDEIRLSPATAATPGHKRTDSRSNTTSGSGTKREGTAPSPSGTESFVLLPESVVGKIPKNGSSRSPSGTSAAGGGAGKTNAPTRRPSGVVSGPSSSNNKASSNTSSSAATNAQSNAGPSSAPSNNNLHATMRLFTLLSSRSELDHPLCADCTNTLIENLERKLEETKRERDGYLAFEREVKKSRDSISTGGLDEKKLEHKIQRVRSTSFTIRCNSHVDYYSFLDSARGRISASHSRVTASRAGATSVRI